MHLLVSSPCRISLMRGHGLFKDPCLFNSVLMGKWLHWHILKCNTVSFHSFCGICVNLNFLYSSISMQNDTYTFLPTPPHQKKKKFPKPTLLSSVQYQYIFNNMHVKSNFTLPALLNNLYIRKKLWYILHNRNKTTLNFKPQGLQNV